MLKIKGLFLALMLVFLACTASSPGCDCNAHASQSRAVPAAK